MLARQMQIDRGLFKVAMSEKDLDGAQVGAGFQQVGSEAMPQRVRVNVLMCESRTLSSVLTRIPDDLGRDRPSPGVPTVARE